MRMANQEKHLIGYGDESWATNSMMRTQSLQQQYKGTVLVYCISDNICRDIRVQIRG